MNDQLSNTMSAIISRGSGMSGEWREVAMRDICIKIGSGATPRGGQESFRGASSTR
jgi:hypothetical protein